MGGLSKTGGRDSSEARLLKNILTWWNLWCIIDASFSLPDKKNIMSGVVQLKYISFISSTLDRFKWVQPSKVANFRCNVCGDSEQSEYKARGYFYYIQKSDTYNFKCQNCGSGLSFRNYLRTYYPHYYQEMRLEQFRNRQSLYSMSAPKKEELSHIPVDMNRLENVESDKILPISELEESHPARQYLCSRRIPESKFGEIFFTENFKEWVHQYQEEDGRRYPDDQRILFLMKDESGRIFGAQGRALDNNSIRYITVKFDDTLPKLFGLNTVNRDLPVLVTEGVIDSLFLPNAVSVCGGDIGESLKVLEMPYKQFIVLLDNEPRSRDTIHRMEKAIDLGANVVFSKIPPEYKDINAVILGGITVGQILEDIKENTYRGARAHVMLRRWSLL